jgi:large subunit ribosomal protein L3
VSKKKKTQEAVIDPEVFERRKLLGRKLGMTQIFEEDGTAVSVTVVEAGPCTVVQVKSREKDGYDAVQVGFSPRAKKVAKPLRGHFEKAGVEPHQHLREFRLTGAEHGLEPGAKLTVEIFEGVEKVDVAAVGKGKGFAGTIKRWHFKRGPAAHGSMNVRQPGSIGSSADPSRVFKGLHMSGHLGARRATCRNLKLVKIEPEGNLLLIRGAVPGPNGCVVEVSASFVKGKKKARS